MEENTKDKSDEPSLNQVLCDKQYRRSTYIVVAMTFFNVLTGIDAIAIFSNRIFTKMNEQ
jgi:hypothetical protein